MAEPPAEKAKTGDDSEDRPNLNRKIEAATWDTYRKKVATWAVRLPVDVTIPTREGEVEGEAGDYLCIDADGGLYPCDAETFEKMYELTEEVAE
ncbi:MAG: hypothetical protein ABEJ85_04945 [Haloarculaceae archaeon]